MAAKRLCVGVIAGAHGVRGEVRVKSFTADPDALAGYGPFTDADGRTVYELSVTGRSRGMMLARVNGCTDRNVAETQRGTELYIERDMLPPADEEEFYYADLIGLEAVCEDGTVFGTVRTVEDYGAGDMIEILQANGKTEVLPFTRAVFPKVDIAAGRLTVVPPEETFASAEHMDGAAEDEDPTDPEREAR